MLRHPILVAAALWLWASPALAQTGVPPESSSGSAFMVSTAPGLLDSPVKGRVIVYLIAGAGVPPDADPSDAPFYEAPQPMFGVDATLPPGGSVTLDDAAASYPVPPSKLGAGTYRAQAVFDIHHDNSDWHREPGNMVSRVVTFTLPSVDGQALVVHLALDKKVPPFDPAKVKGCEYFEMRSELLSKFHGRDIMLRAGVVPPTGRDPARQYPAVYEVPGFGGDWREAAGYSHINEHSDAAAQRLRRECFVIVPDPESGNGHTLFADSANNGPCAQALVQELIPALERKYNLIAKPEARVITGHSSGGWSSLWLALTHPETFGACWSSSPDPVDFRHFQETDIYSEANMYTRAGPPGTDSSTIEVPSFRDHAGQTRMTVRVENAVEQVLGPDNTSGQQWDSWQAVFGPRNAAGHPANLYDPFTGVLDHAVAEQYRKYDIAAMVRADPAKYLPILKKNVRLICGTEDSFFLNEAVTLLKDDVQKLAPADLQGPGYIELLPGDHGTVMMTPRARARWKEMVEDLEAKGVLLRE